MVRHTWGEALHTTRKYRRDKKGLPLLRQRQGDPLAHFVVVIGALALAASRRVDIPARAGALALIADGRINSCTARPSCDRRYAGAAIGFPPRKSACSGRLRCAGGQDVLGGDLGTSWRQQQQQQQQVYTLLIDNYDSYTYNLFQQLAVVNGRAPFVVYNDDNDGNLRYALVFERRCVRLSAEM